MKAGFRLAIAGQSRIARDFRGAAQPGFLRIRDLLLSSDIAFTNFENTVLGGHGGFPVKDGYHAPPGPEVLDCLSWTGFTSLSLANNHAFDLGPGGILSTCEEASARSFLHAGTGTDAKEAAAPRYADLPAGRIALVAMDASPQPDFFYARDAAAGNPSRAGINRLLVKQALRLPGKDYDRLCAISEACGDEARKAAKAYVGFGKRLDPASGAFDFFGSHVERGEAVEETRVVDAADKERGLDSIRQARASADFVIVSLHHHLWSPAWEVVPDWTRQFARACVDAGADVFVGHGVPVLQGLESYQGKPLFYSLGNFIFHSHRQATRNDARLWKSVVACCEFDSRGELAGIELEPIVLGGQDALVDHALDRDIPELASGTVADSILQGFAGLSAELGTRVKIENQKGRISMR